MNPHVASPSDLSRPAMASQTSHASGTSVPLSGYYDALARFLSLTRRLGRGGGYESLTVHRLLRPTAGDEQASASSEVVHQRLLAAIDWPSSAAAPIVIDAGCGFGGTSFFLERHLGGRYDGLTLSAAQQRRAAGEAARLGLGGRCHFHVRPYDRPLGDLMPEPADIVVMIESLAHAADPALALATLSAALKPNGLLAIVDDMPSDGLADEDQDFAAFRQGWCCPAVASRARLLSLLAREGLTTVHDEDLTPLVPQRPAGARERLVRINERCRRVVRLFGPIGLTGPVVLVDSLHGGLMLERLYARRLMEYRLLVARRDR